MSEQNGTGTAAQPAQAAAQPVTSGTGTPQIDPGEYQRLQRIEQQWKGAQPFVEKARGLGFKSAEDFDKWAPVVQKVKDPAAFSRAWEGEPEQEQPLTPSQFEELLNKREAARAAADAEKGHTSAWQEDEKFFSPDEFTKLFDKDLPKDAPKEIREMLADAAYGRYNRLRPTWKYEDGHPLAGKFYKPAGQEGRTSIHQMTKAQYDAAVKYFKAQNLAAIGDAAGKPVTTAGTPAGANGAPGGTPSPNNNKRPGGLPSKADVEAMHEQLKAKRAART